MGRDRPDQPAPSRRKEVEEQRTVLEGRKLWPSPRVVTPALATGRESAWLEKLVVAPLLW